MNYVACAGIRIVNVDINNSAMIKVLCQWDIDKLTGDFMKEMKLCNASVSLCMICT